MNANRRGHSRMGGARRNSLPSAAIFVAAISLGAAPARAASYAAVELEIDVAATADTVWAAVGGFCDIEAWLGMGCTLVAGDGGLGSVRRLGSSIEEVLVGASSRSYTYLQTMGTMAAANYHGTLSVEALTADTARISYTLLWDEDAIEESRRADIRSSFRDAFQNALYRMRALALVR